MEKWGCVREKTRPEARLVRPAEAADLAPRGVDVEGEEARGDLLETEEVARATQRARDQAEHFIRELEQAHGSGATAKEHKQPRWADL